MSRARPFFSVVIPVRNGGTAFSRCLAALRRSEFQDWELIVVDDGSDDDSPAVAERSGARLFFTAGARGPAAARNLGAEHARGEYLFFLDADCVVEPETLARAARALREDPTVSGLFGSYDDAPARPGFVSQYRNLLHHFVHQRGREAACTFWAGCGVLKRAAFLEGGGFDAERYPRPSIEDVELGQRLRAAGHRIRLVKDVQVKHLKAWTLRSMVATDVLRRGAPWAELSLERRWLPNDLNLRVRERSAVAAAAVSAMALVLGLLRLEFVALAAASAAVFVVLDLPLFRFLHGERGPLFALKAVPTHALHRLCCAAGLVWGAWRYVAGSPRRDSSVAEPTGERGGKATGVARSRRAARRSREGAT